MRENWVGLVRDEEGARQDLLLRCYWLSFTNSTAREAEEVRERKMWGSYSYPFKLLKMLYALRPWETNFFHGPFCFYTVDTNFRVV